MSTPLKASLFMLVLLGLAACPDATPIQQKFLADRGFCQDLAETKMQLYTGTVAQSGDAANAQSTQLIAMYGECMRHRNWAVGKPVGEEDKKKEAKE